jgi:hypothetical protein
MKRKLPSFGMLAKEAVAAFARFPVPIIASVISCCICIYFVEADHDQRTANENLWKLLLSSGLCMTLGIGMKFFSESRNHSLMTTMLLQLLVIGVGAAFYFLTPDFKDFSETLGFRYALFVLAAHLFAAIAPFINRGSMNGFWRYNEALFLRFLLSAFFAAVLYAGLAIALLSVEHLFGLKDEIEEEHYADLWFVITGVFHTWFFLAGVPNDLNGLEEDQSYPKSLKIFTQFVLLPLVTIYLLILYAYYGKIIFQWELPRGWVGWLVMSFSVTGILSLLLVFPIRNSEDSKWIRNFSKFYYIALLPLIFLLGLAIYPRISDYGITENRYFLILLTLWLAAISLYFLFSKKKNIKVIPVSLLFMAIFSSFGPWGAFAVSERSQVNRLVGLLEKNNRFDGNHLKYAADTIPREDVREINEVMTYLSRRHDFDNFADAVNLSLDSLNNSDSTLDSTLRNDTYSIRMRLLELMNIPGYEYFIDQETYQEYGEEFSYYTSETSGTESTGWQVSGFDYVSKYYGNYNNFPRNIKAGSAILYIDFDSKKNEMRFGRLGDTTLIIQLSPYIKRLNKVLENPNAYSSYGQIPDTLSVLVNENNQLKIGIHFNNIRGRQKPDSITIDDIGADILIKFKNNAGAN